MQLTRLSVPLLLALPLSISCGGDGVLERQDLRSALSSESVEATGISVEPGSGRRFVLDSEQGIFLQTPDGLELYAALSELTKVDEVPLSAFTDIAALGDDKFALIALNDGFLFDREAGTFDRHFCYEPGFNDPIAAPAPTPLPNPQPDPRPIRPRIDPIDPGQPYYQLANNLTYDAVSDLIIAQPQTFARKDGALLGAHIGTFARDNGAEQVWYELPTQETDAGGLFVDEEGRVVLGIGTELWRVDLSDMQVDLIADLAASLQSIDGLAFDHAAGTLIITDNQADELVELDYLTLLGR